MTANPALSNAPSVIRTNSLMKVYTTEEVETTALNNVSIDIKKGEFVAIMGPSGCGKSTLLNLLGLLDNPSGGEFLFLDNEVGKYTERQRAGLRKGAIGFVFQSFNLIDELTVYENVELPLLYLKASPAERKEKVEAVLGKMNIMHRKGHFPQQLSGGQQQRVAIARAVVANPSLILADEPTGNLDSVNGEEVMRLVVLLVEGERLLHVIDRRTRLSLLEQVARDVVLRLALPLGALRARELILGPGARDQRRDRERLDEFRIADGVGWSM